MSKSKLLNQVEDDFVPSEQFDEAVAQYTGGVAGLESYSQPALDAATRERYSQLVEPMFTSSTSGVAVEIRPKASPLLIRTLDGKNYRIYFKTEFAFEAMYINNICRFLDSRQPGETITFILGAKMDDTQTHVVGPIISAIQSCKAKVYGIAAGYCSIPETMIWCYCHERDVYRYGALSFCKTDIIGVCQAYTAYFNSFFKRAIEIGVLSQTDVDRIWHSGSEHMVLYSDYRAKLAAAANPTPEPATTSEVGPAPY